MNRSIKKLLFRFFILISFFLTTQEVSANSVSKIEMDVYIDSYGNATVTEIWQAYLNHGTEGFRPYTNLDNSAISNFSVSDDSGRTYKSLSRWNVDADFDSKAYKSGLHYISDGLELCWGISNYGNRTYTLKYNISNFVKQYTDTQGIYINFLNLNQSVGSAKITIRSDIPFSLDNARIWAFGYEGSINFVNGNIVLESQEGLSKSQYMVSLVRFESNLFNTSDRSNKSFDYIYDSATSGVDELNPDKKFPKWFIFVFISLGIVVLLFILTVIKHLGAILKLLLSYLGLFFMVLLFGFCLVRFPSLSLLFIFGSFIGYIYWIIKSISKNNKLTKINRYINSLDFGRYGKLLPSDDKINYWREIPCNKDLERAYWVAYNYNVVSTNTLREGVIGAILLKWIKDGLITVSKTKKGLFSIKDNNYAIDFSNMQYANNEIENKLFKMLKAAAGYNNILEAKEFEKWCNKNYEKIQSWFFDFNWMEQRELEKQGLITEQQEEITGMIGKTKIITVQHVNSQLREEAIQLKGLKKFLLDFSMMPEREYFEVHIWEEYLIYAQLLGIADKVEEQFSKLYPRFNEQTRLNIELTTIIRNMAYLGYQGYEEGSHRAVTRSLSSSYDYSGSSRDSGRGGSSYSSGGSSAGGSSGGGFR